MPTDKDFEEFYDDLIILGKKFKDRMSAPDIVDSLCHFAAHVAYWCAPNAKKARKVLLDGIRVDRIESEIAAMKVSGYKELNKK